MGPASAARTQARMALEVAARSAIDDVSAVLLLDDNPALYHEREILRYADVVSPDSCRNGLCGDSEQVGCTERGNDFGLERPSGFFVLIRSSISLVVLGLISPAPLREPMPAAVLPWLQLQLCGRSRAISPYRHGPADVRWLRKRLRRARSSAPPRQAQRQ